jgi:hypothetical protein
MEYTSIVSFRKARVKYFLGKPEKPFPLDPVQAAVAGPERCRVGREMEKSWQSPQPLAILQVGSARQPSTVDRRSAMKIRLSLAALALLVLALPLRAGEQDGVQRAIDRGVAYLKSLQQADGTWPHAEIGPTSLAGLTLLECGVPANDPAVVKAARVARQAAVNLTGTYSLALTILFLDRLGDPADVFLIESMTVRLLAGQNSVGGWTYECPAISEQEQRRLTTLLRRRNELVATKELPRAGTTRTEKDLPKEIQQQLALIKNQQAGAGGLAGTAGLTTATTTRTRSSPSWGCGWPIATDFRSATP